MTSHAANLQVITHDDTRKNPKHWRAWREGEVGKDFPLISFIAVENMFTADAPDHTRLRKLMKPRSFSPAGMKKLRPRVERIVNDLLDQLPSSDADGHVDLRQHFTLPLPMTLIAELFGVNAEEQVRFHRILTVLFDQENTTPEIAERNHAELAAALSALVERKRAEPGDDLTSELIAARAEDGDRFSESELVWMMGLMIGAGFETTVNLITNAIRALLAHPEQLDLVKDGTQPWSAAVEETLRFDTPTPVLPFYYTAADVEIAGTPIPAGEPLVMCLGAAGRDPEQHGESANVFDITRDQQQHLAFSHGPHVCLGAHLARMEAAIALERVFTRFPGLRLAVADDELEPLPSLIAGGVADLPVQLK